MARNGFVYMMANRYRGRTYLGVTSNLLRRAFEHRNGLCDGYSKQWNCILLVWFEQFEDIQDARAHEWKLKKWRRAWKIALIEEVNPHWMDLFEQIA